MIRCRTLVDLLRERAENSPERGYRFVRDGVTVDDVMSYHDLDGDARRIGGALQAQGVGPGSPVLLFAPGLDFIRGLFGCLYASAVAVPVEPPDLGSLQRTLQRLRLIAADCQPGWVLTTSAFAGVARSVVSVVSELASAVWMVIDAGPADAGVHWTTRGKESDLALLQYTSGSTREPHGVMLTHSNLLHNQELIRTAFRHREGDFVGVTWLPLYHDMGLIGMGLQPLYIGGDCVMMPPTDFLRDPHTWLAAISAFGGTTSGAPNFAYELCARKISDEKLETLNLASWRVAFCGAEPVRAATLDRFTQRFAPQGFKKSAFVPCYGLAEASLLVSGRSWDADPVVIQVEDAELRQGRIGLSSRGTGRPLVGCGPVVGDLEIAIVDSGESPVEPRRVGEIWLRGGSVGLGYWGRPEATRETFQARLAGTDQGPFLRTGDLGFLDDEGELFLVGRRKDLIIVRGVNYYPQDLEATAEATWRGFHRGASAAFALAREDTEGAVLICEYDEREPAPQNWSAVVDAVRAAIGQEYGLALEGVAVAGRGQVPKTSSGKVQRYLARARYLEGSLQILHEWRSVHPEEQPPAHRPRPLRTQAEMEEFITNWVSARLQRPVPPSSDFTGLGLDSLDLAMLVGDLGERTGCEIRPRAALDFPTAHSLAAYVEGIVAAGGVENLSPSALARSRP
ncbi:MAG: AMP-binding protein [Gemmatimonadales bacterium]